MSDDTKRTFEYIQNRAESINRYSDALRENLEKVSEWVDDLDAGVEVFDTEYLDAETGGYTVLAFDNDALFFTERNSNGKVEIDAFGIICYSRTISDVSRKVLIAAVQRLPAFLQLVLERLTKHEATLQTASDAAVKLASIIEIMTGTENPAWKSLVLKGLSQVPKDDVSPRQVSEILSCIVEKGEGSLAEALRQVLTGEAK